MKENKKINKKNRSSEMSRYGKLSTKRRQVSESGYTQTRPKRTIWENKIERKKPEQPSQTAMELRRRRWQRLRSRSPPRQYGGKSSH